MGVFNINSAAETRDYKPLIFNFDIIRGSEGMQIKDATIIFRKSFITGDNEVTVTADTTINTYTYSGEVNPVGEPLNFTPGTLELSSVGVTENLGTGASVVNTELQDISGTPLSAPFNISLTENDTTLGFQLFIDTFNSGTIESSFTFDITVLDNLGLNPITRTVIVNMLNNL